MGMHPRKNLGIRRFLRNKKMEAKASFFVPPSPLKGELGKGGLKREVRSGKLEVGGYWLWVYPLAP
jgi:hypothetical protein